jgi:hypothetical protein
MVDIFLRSIALMIGCWWDCDEKMDGMEWGIDKYE